MQFLNRSIVITVLSISSMACVGQAAATAPAMPAAVQGSGPSSTMLQPALTGILQALAILHTEKWKAPVPVRDETDANIRSIRRDIDTVLPPMLASADAMPTSVTMGLPVLRNVDALYDVLLRVATVGKMAAPAQQSAALDKAIAGLETSRRTLGDQLQEHAAASEKQVSDLQAALRAVPPPVVAAPVVAAPVAPVKKRVVKKKPKVVVPADSSAPKTP